MSKICPKDNYMIKTDFFRDKLRHKPYGILFHDKIVIRSEKNYWYKIEPEYPNLSIRKRHIDKRLSLTPMKKGMKGIEWYNVFRFSLF